jgi:hypothetical protein
MDFVGLYEDSEHGLQYYYFEDNGHDGARFAIVWDITKYAVVDRIVGRKYNSRGQ